jgi:hypothetical protein
MNKKRRLLLLGLGALLIFGAPFAYSAIIALPALPWVVSTAYYSSIARFLATSTVRQVAQGMSRMQPVAGSESLSRYELSWNSQSRFEATMAVRRIIEKTAEEMLKDGEISQAKYDDFIKSHIEYHKTCDQCDDKFYDECVEGEPDSRGNSYPRYPSKKQIGKWKDGYKKDEGIREKLCKVLRAKRAQAEKCLEQRVGTLAKHPEITPGAHLDEIEDRKKAVENFRKELGRFCERPSPHSGKAGRCSFELGRSPSLAAEGADLCLARR